MARIPQGILGGIRGKVGNIIGASWKGINYIRSMPLSVANPNTAAQQAQRGAFTQVVIVSRLFLSTLVHTYWDPFARAMSGYNAFIRANIDAYTTGGFTTPADFVASIGILRGFQDLVITGNDGVGLVLTFTDNTGLGDALATDQIVAFWYNETQHYYKFLELPAETRADSPVSVADTDVAENDVVSGYIFLIRPDLEKISDSTYDQATIAA